MAAPPSFRFLPAEIAEMEAIANQLSNNAATPSLAVVQGLTDRFSASRGRAGNENLAVQILTWFKNRRHPHLRSGHGPQQRRWPHQPPRYPTSAPLQMAVLGSHREHTGDSSSHATPATQPTGSLSGNEQMEGDPIQFEAKSAIDGAWYDVAGFLSKRNFETGNLEVKVRLYGFGAEYDEWVDVRTCVRKRSLPCAATECAIVDRGDLVLCFQWRDTHALYFDAHVTDIQRRQHDVRGCRCRFLIRYDHDRSEEIVSLRKLCRRPETNYRLPILHAAMAAAHVPGPPEDTNVELSSQAPKNDEHQH